MIFVIGSQIGHTTSGHGTIVVVAAAVVVVVVAAAVVVVVTVVLVVVGQHACGCETQQSGLYGSYERLIVWQKSPHALGPPVKNELHVFVSTQ